MPLLSPCGEKEAVEEMGEMAMAGYGLDKAVRASISFDTPCGALLRELEVRFSAGRKCCPVIDVRGVLDLLCFFTKNCVDLKGTDNLFLRCWFLDLLVSFDYEAEPGCLLVSETRRFLSVSRF